MWPARKNDVPCSSGVIGPGVVRLYPLKYSKTLNSMPHLPIEPTVRALTDTLASPTCARPTPFLARIIPTPATPIDRPELAAAVAPPSGKVKPYDGERREGLPVKKRWRTSTPTPRAPVNRDPRPTRSPTPLTARESH